LIFLDIVKSIKEFYLNSKRVINVSYKPTNDVFKRTLKIVVIGILIIGAMGYIISTLIGFVLP